MNSGIQTSLTVDWAFIHICAYAYLTHTRVIGYHT